MSNPSQFCPQQPGQFYPQQQQRSGCSCLTMILVALLGGGAVLAALCCGVGVYFSQPPRASAAAAEPFSAGDVPLPVFPERGEMQAVSPQVMLHEVSLGDDDDGFYDMPGVGGKLLLYLPAGKIRPKSLPCVLITGAGSDLLSGMQLGEGDNPEQLPYVQAGYAVVAYELDGPSDEGTDPAAMRRSYEAFKAARAGLVNARNALQFVLDEVPEVDPSKIYAAGHSSAATHALLFAEHEPRLAGVIAYAPAVNVPKRFGPILRVLAFQLPGVVDFAAQSSPHTHANRLKCPTFLFHCEDDTNCPIADTRNFASQVKQQGTEATFVTAASGGHYQSMIDEGIPAAIKWLRDQERKKN
jgi:dienelactone hydrolase